MTERDEEANRFSARATRYAKMGLNAGAFAAKVGVSRLSGGGGGDDARAFTEALGAMKGPMMKVAQMLATIPDALPSEYSEQLMKLQSQAPPMGPAFVRRRMQAELGADWRGRFAEFDLHPSAAASLGQVHKALRHDGETVACKLQYPDMASAVEADLTQLNMLFSMHRALGSSIDTREVAGEIASRLREELDYLREAKVARLYALMLADRDDIRVPRVHAELSTRRLLTLEWIGGGKLLDFEHDSAEVRARIAKLLFEAWWRPFVRFGVIHADPHLGNYSVVAKGVGEAREIEALNLYDYGCVRIFPARFVMGTVELYRAQQTDDRDRLVHAYELWGFRNLTRDTMDAMDVWARFLTAPIRDDRVRSVADGVKPSEYGRKEISAVMKALRQQGGDLVIPREFVFMERAAIGLGAAFLRLRAELNFHRLYEETIDGFDVDVVRTRQAEALAQTGLEAAPT